MNNPTPESTERARKWLMKQDQVNLALYAYAHTENGAVNSLALEIDRIAIEAQERIVNNLKGAERHEWWEMAEKLKAQRAALDAAHKAGEGE